jgi:hypothetical protein
MLNFGRLLLDMHNIVAKLFYGVSELCATTHVLLCCFQCVR